MYSYIKPFIAFFFAFSFHFSSAQFDESNQISFSHFNTQEGLSQASVNAILQDSKGFLWFGTDDGLNRFDGSHFRIFRHVPGDSSSIMGNNVQVIFEDDTNNIWIGTSEGLTRYDRHLEKFTPFYATGIEYYTCTDIEYDRSRNRLWLASGLHGIAYLDLNTNSLAMYQHVALAEKNVLKIELVNDNLYIGTQEHGALKIELSSGASSDITLSGKRIANPIRAMLAADNVLWIGTEGDGLISYDLSTNQIKTFTKEKNLLSDNKVWAIARETNGKLWIGTDGGGLCMISADQTRSDFYRHSEYIPRTLSANTIRSLLVDQSNDLWIGTFNGGVSYYSAFNVNFQCFHKDPLNPNALSHDAILSFCERSDGSLFIGTDGGGLNFYRDGKFYQYKFPGSVETPNVILCIRQTALGDLLIGTYQNGLYRVSKNNTVVQYKNKPNDSTSLSSDIVWDAAEDNAGNIWLATELGINRLNAGTRKFTHVNNLTTSDNKEIFTADFIQSLRIVDHNLYGGMYGMLLVHDFQKNITKKIYSSDGTYVGVPNKQILSICADTKHPGVIWFSGRGEALVRYDPSSDELTLIKEKDGLPNSLVYALQTDDDGVVWMTTNKGLVRYDHDKKQFFTFSQDFGINIEPFNDNAAYRTKAGYLLFGGTNGFTAFKPTAPDLEERKFQVSFTGFQLFNEEVQIDNKILSRSITEVDELTLPYDKARFMSFSFSALQFLAPSAIHYQYMLEGFDNKWYETNNHVVSFSNLLPGNYTLRIKAGYGGAFWGDERALSIRIIPPWWMTWYARVGGVVLLIFIGYVVTRYRTYSLKKRKIALERIVEEQNRAIRAKNVELETQNEELIRHNEELTRQRETIRVQHDMLSEAKTQLQEANQSLEHQVHLRTEKLNDTITVLNKTIKELDAFLYSASHDLVAPLKSVLGLVNLARAEDTDHKLLPYLNHIENTVRKLEGVLHTLMQHSYNAKGADQRQIADLKLLVKEAIGEQQFIPEAKRIRFDIDFSDAVITTDIPRLKIILSNLIGNAIKYHDPTKNENIVKIEFSRQDHIWVLALTDNGIGIEGSRIDRIFDMFYRATESAKGSGLGLYIVKETVERLGGEITVDSEYGKWTRFTLRFKDFAPVMAN